KGREQPKIRIFYQCYFCDLTSARPNGTQQHILPDPDELAVDHGTCEHNESRHNAEQCQKPDDQPQFVEQFVYRPENEPKINNGYIWKREYKLLLQRVGYLLIVHACSSHEYLRCIFQYTGRKNKNKIGRIPGPLHFSYTTDERLHRYTLHIKHQGITHLDIKI